MEAKPLLSTSNAGEEDGIELVDRKAKPFGGSDDHQHEAAGSNSKAKSDRVYLDADDEDLVEDGRFVPTAEEQKTLRRVKDHIPWSAFLVALIELSERFTGPFNNYIENPYPYRVEGDQRIPGALGQGQKTAVALTDFFQFWCYVTPVFGAIIADQYLGRYKTILYFSYAYLAGLFILFITSLPASIESSVAYGGFFTSLIVIGIGTGGIKANVSSLIAEQYSRTELRIRVLKSGERVIVDPAVTIQSIFMFFYLCINVGALSSIFTTELEQRVGFWCAFLVPLLAFCVAIPTLVFGRKLYITRPPQGSVVLNSFKVIWIGSWTLNMDSAKPSNRARLGARYVDWDDNFVDEVKRALIACKVFAFFPVYWLVYSQMLNNFVSQASHMALHGIPNDILGNIDPITIICCIPVMERVFYPALRKIGIKFRPITRIFWGFITGSVAMFLAALVQRRIDAYPPGTVHVAYLAPVYFFVGISEIFASITGLEYAYTKAPTSMKSFVMSICLLQSAVGSALAMALAPTAVPAKMAAMYTGLGVACLIAGVVFWLLYSRYNAQEDDLNELEGKGQKARRT